MEISHEELKELVKEERRAYYRALRKRDPEAERARHERYWENRVLKKLAAQAEQEQKEEQNAED